MLLSCQKEKIIIGEIAIIPQPVEQIVGQGYFEISPGTLIAVENEEQAFLAHQFSQLFKNVSTWEPKVEIGQNGDITFVTDKSLTEEAYKLSVKTSGIIIKAASRSGFFYAIESLKQLLPIEIYSMHPVNIRWGVPVVEINDQPAFEWRGYMLDVSRHFLDKNEIKSVIDFMAMLKLNRFHWHLTDDQGWRIEIKSYPKLTEIGAWRVNYNVTNESIYNWFGRPEQTVEDSATYGGFYTQEEVKEIVDYAKGKCIEIIPEIDMPGHSQAIVASYPEIGCVNAKPFVATGGVVKNNTLNPGKDDTFIFAEKVINEISNLFPFSYIHIGGDECNKEQWSQDPFVKQRMKDEGLNNLEEVQSYFIKRVENIINKQGKRMIGWDEILEGGLAPNATVMSWRGHDGGIAAAKMGHEVIMTPQNFCYLDLKQGDPDMEPNLGYSELLLSTSYNYNVIPDELSVEEGALIKGIQGNMWTESISDWSKLTYMTFPRLFAIAENSWTRQQDKNWNNFSKRLFKHLERFDLQNIRYAKSAFSPRIYHEGNGEKIKVYMSLEVSDLSIRYTLDGTDPTPQSIAYNEEFEISESAIIKARAFKDDKEVGYVSTLHLPIHKAAGKKVIGYSNDEPIEITKLTDLNYGKLSNEDGSWQYFSSDTELVILFENTTAFKEVTFNALKYTISGIYPPEFVEILGSNDGIEFISIGNTYNTEALVQGRNKIPYAIPIHASNFKILKIKATTKSPILKGHHLQGGQSKMAIDELVVN